MPSGALGEWALGCGVRCVLRHVQRIAKGANCRGVTQIVTIDLESESDKGFWITWGYLFFFVLTKLRPLYTCEVSHRAAQLLRTQVRPEIGVRGLWGRSEGTWLQLVCCALSLVSCWSYKPTCSSNSDTVMHGQRNPALPTRYK